MRTLTNPNHKKPAGYKLKAVIFFVVTHWRDDDTSGYHKERMEVIQTCLETMRDRAHCDHTFFVWDNGSSRLLLDWLQDDFQPDILVQSPNLGKGLARAMALKMLPLNAVVCCSDDDIYYYDNWLFPQVGILRLFPNVAAVSGYPIRTQFRRGIESTLEWARACAKLEQGRFIPESWERQHAASVGWSWDKYNKLTENDVDYRMSYLGQRVYAQSHHCQFIGIVEKISQVADAAVDGLLTPDEWPFDVALGEVGLRLCTEERLCRHIGNILDEDLRDVR